MKNNGAEKPTKIDYKKKDKSLYKATTTPSLVEVPPMQFIMVAGTGDPNIEGGTYQQSMELLYGLSWTIKMSKMSGNEPQGYFEYVIPPLEGLWWLEGYVFDGQSIADKAGFFWISMIRQPEFVTQQVFSWAKETLLKKKPHIDVNLARLEVYEEGQCAQLLHLGPYDEEPESINKLNAFINEQDLVNDIADEIEAFPLRHRHHEIYLSDPRKTKPENLKTIIRHPVKQKTT